MYLVSITRDMAWPQVEGPKEQQVAETSGIRERLFDSSPNFRGTGRATMRNTIWQCLCHRTLNDQDNNKNRKYGPE